MEDDPLFCAQFPALLHHLCADTVNVLNVVLPGGLSVGIQGSCVVLIFWKTSKLLTKIKKFYSHFVSYLGFCSTEEDQIHNGATLHVSNPVLSIPVLLMPW